MANIEQKVDGTVWRSLLYSTVCLNVKGNVELITVIKTDTLTNRYITHFRKCLKRRYSISVILSDQGVVFFHVSVSVSTRFRFLTFCLLNYMYHTLTQMLCPIYIYIVLHLYNYILYICLEHTICSWLFCHFW